VHDQGEKKVYLVSDLVRDFTVCDIKSQVNNVNMGVKVFEK
jgi:hypothetical protein